ncbi:L-alanine-DL-glutamate epimerase-like enolase superfamily enzyme [Pseudomonas sp. URMO17WK12:I6]|jgi:L-alanine-DL-glutamate epimerase-like enolase superfamily enzyme|uniref:mandelate racemase/muconate lactonizing enzyme family protein n=1 Tax=Pseudomonas sp. URMO17WK12:I6 TaxID=1261629 RepID=UPI000DAE81F3|nr:mandelate racemase/muconate lactonizing enzyme family protein [Pseudomonas sp. URMO17WK12:I6]PZW53717.1 L-alanine-DL-glutamate epimerase-like enolase superfamily enzyme [Pseudomonas sp. URMO17WK12:I6]
MKIASVHIYTHELPVLDGPYTMANQVVYSLTTTLVKLVGDNGLFGWGETCPVGPTFSESHSRGAVAALIEMAKGLVGTEVLPVPLHRRMDGLLKGHNYAKAAIDIAMHDLLGKHLGLSVSDLLGGALADRLPSYSVVGISDPDESARLAVDKRDQGYPRLQIKVGGRPIEEDIAAVQKVWEAVGSSRIKLAVDANRGLNTRDTLRLCRECANIPFILEQPCNTVEDFQKIRSQISHAMYMDESCTSINTAITVAGTGLVDGFGMKVTALGGLHPMRAFRDICAARNLPHTCDDAWGGDLIAAACTHIGATVAPELLEGVWIAAPMIGGHYDQKNGIRVEGGHINRPQGVGLGVVPEEGIFGEPLASF